MTNAINVGTIPQFELRHRLQVARERTGLEQVEFAQELGISRGTVSNVERGRTAPREITLRAWALRSGVDLHWLKYGEVPSPSDDGTHGARPEGFEPPTFWLADVMSIPRLSNAA